MKSLKFLDMYKQQFSFTHKGKTNINTIFGVIISFLTFIIIMINAFIIGNDIIYKQKPREIKSTNNQIHTPTIRLNNKISKLGLSISDSSGNEVIDESIFKVFPYIYMQKIVNNTKIIYTEYPLEMDDCEKSDSVFYRRCIKNQDIYIGGDWNKDHLTYLMFRITRCKNETQNIVL